MTVLTTVSKLEKYRSRLPAGESAFNAVLNDYRQQAKRRGLEWALTAEEAKALFQGSCVFCGRPPVQVKKIRQGRGFFAFNGIDRTTNYVGYVASNCVTCCWVCNWMKRDLTTGEFLEHVRLICRHTNPDAEGADTKNSDTQFP